MTPEQINLLLKTRPFRPLRFIFSEGREEFIDHPDLVIVGFDWIEFIQRRPGTEFAELAQFYSMLHLVAVEHVDEPAKASAAN